MNKTPNDKLLTIYKTDKITKNALTQKLTQNGKRGNIALRK